MSDAPVVGPALPEDSPAISALIDQYVPSGMLLPRAPEYVSERTLDFLVARSGPKLIGCVHLEEYSPSLAEVRSLVVDPEWQGRGVGAALMRGIERLALTRDYSTVFAVSNNEAFFRSQGYERAEIRELDKERSEVSRFKGVFARRLARR